MIRNRSKTAFIRQIVPDFAVFGNAKGFRSPQEILPPSGIRRTRGKDCDGSLYLDDDRDDHRFAVEALVEVAVESAVDRALEGLAVLLAAVERFDVRFLCAQDDFTRDRLLFGAVDQSARNHVGVADGALAVGVD